MKSLFHMIFQEDAAQTRNVAVSLIIWLQTFELLRKVLHDPVVEGAAECSCISSKFYRLISSIVSLF